MDRAPALPTACPGVSLEGEDATGLLPKSGVCPGGLASDQGHGDDHFLPFEGLESRALLGDFPSFYGWDGRVVHADKHGRPFRAVGGESVYSGLTIRCDINHLRGVGLVSRSSDRPSCCCATSHDQRDNNDAFHSILLCSCLCG